MLYSPASRGHLAAREAVCRYYAEKGFSVSPEQIFLTASTSEAYSYLFRLLVNSGEQVLFPSPSYPLFAFLGDLNDVRTDFYRLVYDKKWNIDSQGISQILGGDAKALVMVNPNNPTGSFISPEELGAINALCRKRNVALICDEVFSDFVFDQDKKYLSLVNNHHVLTFVLGGISKTLGLPQMKLSWIVLNGPRDVVEAAAARLEMIADTYLSVSTPVQNALPVWFTYRKEIQAEIQARIKQNFKFLKECAGMAQDCELLEAEGGWYAVLSIPDIYSEEQWVLAFLNRDYVAVHPGYFFDFDREAYVVISLLPPPDIFQEGIKRIFDRIKGGQL
jgi:aspartate/methionine/tyrosine aminotransferase